MLNYKCMTLARDGSVLCIHTRGHACECVCVCVCVSNLHPSLGHNSSLGMFRPPCLIRRVPADVCVCVCVCVRERRKIELTV